MRAPPITVHVHVDGLDIERLERKLARIMELLLELRSTEGEIRMDLTELDAAVAQIEEDVAADTSLDASAVTLLDRISGLLEAQADDPEAVRALAERLRAASSAGGTSNVNLADALVRNTPADPAVGGGEPVG